MRVGILGCFFPVTVFPVPGIRYSINFVELIIINFK